MNKLFRNYFFARRLKKRKHPLRAGEYFLRSIAKKEIEMGIQ